ncbi:MAG: hypothetical protein WD554_04070 [Flavobacteriaceae bacterium]
MKKCITLIFCLMLSIAYSQELIVNDSIKITLVKSKEVSKTFNARSKTKLKSKEAEKILVRCKIESIHKTPVDINAFSLLDTSNKLRYRITEFMGYKAVGIGGTGVRYKPYLKKRLVNKKGRPYPSLNLPKYDKKVKDSFDTYLFEGYTNVMVPITFSKSKKLNSIVYYGPVEGNNFTAEMFFTVIVSKAEPYLELYYGKEKVAPIEME